MVHTQNYLGETPLILLLSNTHWNGDHHPEKLIKCFLQKGSNAILQISDHKGYLPLHYACQNKNINLLAIELLVDAYPEAQVRRAGGGQLPSQMIAGSSCKRAYLKYRILSSVVYIIARKNNIPDEVAPLLLSFVGSMDV